MRKILFILMMLVASSATMMAYDFEVDGIYYNKNGTKAIVTYKTTRYDSYSGDVIIPETVTYGGTTYTVTAIGKDAFYDCSRPTRVTVPNTVITISDEAFMNSEGLESVILPNSITAIGNYVFYGCKNLQSLTIPESVKTIGEYAFSNCNSLTSLFFPSSIKSISEDAFNCSAPTNIYITDLKAWCEISFGNSSSNPLSNGGHLCLNGEEIFDLVIPASVTFISKYAFNDYRDLNSVTIPNTVTKIEENAFDYCIDLTAVYITDLKAWCGISFGNANSNPLNNAFHLYLNGEEVSDLMIPSSVTAIKANTFSNCRSITSLVIPNSVTSIGGSAFIGCRNMTSADIGSSVTNIGYWAFTSCIGLTSVTCRSEEPPTAHLYGFHEDVFSNALLLVPAQSLGKYRAHATWGKFAHIEAFNAGEIDTLKTATPYVGEETQFTLSLENEESDPDATIYYAYNGGDYWQEYTGPIEFYDLGYCYFENLRFYAVADGKLPSDTVDYDFYVHRYCYDFIVDGIYYLKTGAQTVSVGTEYDLRYRLYASMPSCYSGDVVIPESVTSGGKTYTVTGIIPYAFYSSNRLNSVDIPNTVTSIGAEAFYNSWNICQIICRASVPPVFEQEDGSFGDFFSCYDLATLYVPAESLQAYRNHEVWGRFETIAAIEDEHEVGDINGDGTISISDVTGLIDLLLSGGDMPSYADANGDGAVTIKDVTDLIDMLLSGN